MRNPIPANPYRLISKTTPENNPGRGWTALRIFSNYSSYPVATPPDAQVAQLVEQWTENPRVGSSNLSLGTIFPLMK